MCTLAILTLSLFPIPEVPHIEDIPLVDKWVHFIMYGGLLMCVWIDWIRKKLRPKFKHNFYSILFGIALGGLIELIQPLVSRSGEMLDFYADSIGVFIGYISGFIISRYFSKIYKDN